MRQYICILAAPLLLGGCGIVDFGGNVVEGTWSAMRGAFNSATSFLRSAPEPEEPEYTYARESEGGYGQGYAHAQSFESRRSQAADQARLSQAPFNQAQTNQGPLTLRPREMSAQSQQASAPVPQMSSNPKTAAVQQLLAQSEPSLDYPETGYIPKDKPISTSRTPYRAGASLTPAPAQTGGSNYTWTPGGSATPTAPQSSGADYAWSPNGPSVTSAPAAPVTRVPAAASAPTQYSWTPGGSAAPAPASKPVYQKQAAMPIRPAPQQTAPVIPDYTYTPPRQTAPAPVTAPRQPAYMTPSYAETYSAPVAPRSYSGYSNNTVDVYGASSSTRQVGQRPATQYVAPRQSTPARQYSQPQYAAPPAASDTMPELSYVNLRGQTRTSDFEQCQARAGQLITFTQRGPQIHPAFDGCMRQLGYVPESEALASMQGQVGR